MNTFSPKNVILNARRESDITDVKLKSSFGKPYDLTLKETVDTQINKEKWGVDLYKPNNLILQPQQRAFK